MKKEGDIIERMIDRIKARHPEIPAEEWECIRHENRAAEGGERHYVWKAVVRGKAFSLGRRLASGESIREAISNSGLSRTTGYRVLGWKR